MSAPRGPALWKMNKMELEAEAFRLGAVVHRSWTTAELRAVIQQHRDLYEPDEEKLPKGMSTMKLEELIAIAESLGADVPQRPTRGIVQHLIRQHALGMGHHVVGFGRHRGKLFREVPPDYLEWAAREVAAKGESASPDLIILAEYGTKKKKNTERMRRSEDPEATATVPYEPSENSGTASSWTRVLPTGTHPHGAYPKARGRTRALETYRMDRENMDQDIPYSVVDEIQELETRLAILRDRHGLQPPTDGETQEDS